MGRFPFFACSTALVLVAGCSAEAPEARVDRLGKMRGEIINGTLDTTHQAVVALFGNQSACTATIIGVSGSSGFALTAAHCVADAPQVVVQGNDYNSSSTIDYPVVDYAAHPSYNGQTYDFAMVEFAGASGSTPVIPAMSPAEDNLVDGSDVVFVGYGVTENSNNNTKRYKVDGELADVSALLLEYYQPNGGPCSGDSGGPSLSLVGGQERVSGVTSYGDQNCTQYGASGRASAVYDSFIQPFMGGGGGGQDCGQCAQGSQSGSAPCADEADACFNNGACNALVGCINECPDDACVQDCANQAGQAAVDLYLGVVDCICDVACVTECASQCGGSSSSTSTSTTGSGPTGASGVGGTGSGTGSGPGAGVGGAGAGTTSGGDDDGNDDDDDDDKRSNDTDSGCAVAAGAPATQNLLIGLALALAAATARRRRRA